MDEVNIAKNEQKLKDSGERRAVSTGAVRDRAKGKGRMDLLPWFALEELSKHFEAGAEKYGANNYLKGMPLSWFVDSGLRHVVKAMRGQTDEPHWRAVAWNFLCCLEIMRRIELGLLPKELNDLLPELPSDVQNKL